MWIDGVRADLSLWKGWAGVIRAECGFFLI